MSAKIAARTVYRGVGFRVLDLGFWVWGLGFRVLSKVLFFSVGSLTNVRKPNS